MTLDIGLPARAASAALLAVQSRARGRSHQPGLLTAGLVPSSTALGAAQDELRAEYETYVQTVSSPEHAMSLEAAALLLWTCRTRDVQHVGDWGSGFSSYVLRLAQKAKPSMTVESLDNSAEWLPKTLAWLSEHDLPTSGVDLYAPGEPDRLDLLFYDLGFLDVRENEMGAAFDAVRPGGLLIVDDTHYRGLYRKAHLLAEQRGLNVYNLRASTLDRFSRYALLVTDIRC